MYCVHVMSEAKPGSKEKRKKGASFQTVSQLHKVSKSDVVLDFLCLKYLQMLRVNKKRVSQLRLAVMFR